MEKKYLVLIVDDRKENRILLKKTIKSKGYNVQEANNGKEGLKKVRLQKPDLIISDVLMPVMDGFMFCREIKKDTKLTNIPFIFYTATYVDKKDEEFALSLGAEKYIVKPMEPKKLLTLMVQIIEKYKKGNHLTQKKIAPKDEEVFKLYSERLIHKLEKKTRDLEKEVIHSKRQEDELREAQHIAKIGRWELNLKNNELKWAPEIYKIFEINEKKFGANYDSFIEAIHPDDREVVNKMYTDSLIDRKPYNIEHRLLMKDGRIKWVNEICRTEYDLKGKAIRSIGIVQDITDKKLVENALQDNEKKYRTYIENAPEGIFIVDSSGKYIDVNRAACQMTGYSREELLDMSIQDLASPESPPEKFKPVTDLKKKEESDIETILRRKNGNDFHVALSRVALSDDRFMAFCTDITKRKKAEEELRKSELKFRLLADHTSDWEYWIDENGKYIYLSPSCERITGYTPDEFISNPELLFKIVIGNYAKEVERHYKDENNNKKNILNLEFPIITKSGEERWLEHNCNPVFDEKNNFCGRRGNNRDITKRKQVEEELKKHQDNLEALVRERTAEIEENNVRLQRFHDATINRELRMKELKDENEKLKAQLNKY